MKSLIGFTPIFSLLLQLVAIIGFQTGAFYYVQEQVKDGYPNCTWMHFLTAVSLHVVKFPHQLVGAEGGG